jgi:DNA-binding response OmpR family regulator
MINTNILIIEDNPADIALIEAYLKESGFKHTLYKYDSLFGGLDFLKEQTVDLVLLDLKLVDVEGFKTLQLFREKVPDIPVIVLTGFKNEIMGIQSVRAGAQDFLVKGDFDSRSLTRTIRYSLQRFEAQVKLQKRAKQLSQNERRNQLAHQIAHFGKWEMDIVNNSMTWDDEIFRFFGFSPQSFQPTLSDYTKYVHVEDKSKVEQFFEEAIKDGQPHHIDHRIVIDNTVVKYLQIKAQVSYDEQANRILLVGGVQDITSLREQQQKEVLIKADDKIPDIEESLFTEYNFNIRTPIASIVNFLFLLEKTSLSDLQSDYIYSIKSSLDDLSFALNNWFNLTTFKEGNLTLKLSEISLADSVRVLENVSAIRVEHALSTITFTTSPNLPPVIITDHQKLSQILYNIIEAAIHLGKEGQHIQLTIGQKFVKKTSLSLTIHATFESNIKKIEIAQRLLSQESTDIDEIAHLYRDYLPIIITEKLVNCLEGIFDLTPKSAGNSLEVYCEIPVQIKEGGHLNLPESPISPTKILLVEDHDLHRLATKRMLNSWSKNVSVDIAENGQQAIEKALKEDYDIILMDLQMPILNGIESAIKIRAKYDTPIIALTANESKQEQERCMMVGVNDYIVKPVKPKNLFSRIMRQLYLNRKEESAW